MAAKTLSTVETLTRYILGDVSTSQVPGDIFTYSNSAIFTLTETNVIAVSSVLHNDVELSSSEYSYDSSTNKVTVSASLTAGDTIEVQYTYYPNYSSTEIQTYVRVAITHLSVSNYATFQIASDGTLYPEPEDNEEHLIALLTSILIEPENKSYRLPDVSVNVPKSVPTHDLIRKTIAIFKHNTHGNFFVTN